VNLVVDEVVELHDVHDAHGHLVREGLAGAAVEETGLSRGRERGAREELEDLLLRRAVEDGRCDVDATGGRAGELHDVVVGQRVDEVGRFLGAVELLQLLLEPVDRRPAVLLELVVDLAAELARGPPEDGVSRICPTFMRLGTPSGFRTTSTGVPSARYGMSSSGGCGRGRPCCRDGPPSCRRPAACA
jgi:hypothetical protein